MTWQNSKSLFNISFSFLFFSFITKVEHGKYHVTSHRVTEWSCHGSQSQHVTKKLANGHEDCGRQDT